MHEQLHPPAAPRKPLVYGSVCSGIEAATVAWHPLGWRPAFFSEIDNFPRALLQHRYPDVPLHGDFTTIQEHDYDPIDLLVGGTPCQAFSVAGLRKGFADQRGNLTLEFIRLAQRLRPRWLVWENVPGVLSIDRGRAFGSFLGGLAELGYGFAYRVLDAQHFGVPQRRHRVFVVGYLGDWRPPAAVLFERESLLRDITPSRETGEGVAICPTLRAGGNSTGGDRPPGTDVDTADSLIVLPWSRNDDAPSAPMTFPATMSGTQRASTKGISSSLGSANRTAIAIPILEAGARTGISTDDIRAGIGIGEPGDPMFTLQAGKQHAIGCFKAGQGSKSRSIGYSEHLAPTLPSSDSGSNRTPALMMGMAVRRLIPEECEKLQGFRPGYTLIPCRGKPAADGPRYKALGNSMAVPCMAHIGQQIDMVDGMLHQHQLAA